MRRQVSFFDSSALFIQSTAKMLRAINLVFDGRLNSSIDGVRCSLLRQRSASVFNNQRLVQPPALIWQNLQQRPLPFRDWDAFDRRNVE